MKWTTWQNIGVDRMACIWLVRRHIDRSATFHFVETGSAPREGQGMTFDMPGARFTHRGPHCSFHTLVAEHRLDDPVLHRLARIIDEADVAQEVTLEPVAAGLDLVCRGLRRTATDDHAAVERALLLYDAVYAELKAGVSGAESPRRIEVPKSKGEATLKWITRERPKIDRIACPWLISRFVDKDAEFLYVPPDQVKATAAQTGATPYDVEGVELTHEGPLCSFDAIVRKYNIKDPAVQEMALIIRGADTSRHDLHKACPGVYATLIGLSRNFSDDQEQLRHGMTVCDALYAWCKFARDEKHDWNPQRKA